MSNSKDRVQNSRLFFVSTAGPGKKEARGVDERFEQSRADSELLCHLESSASSTARSDKFDPKDDGDEYMRPFFV
jgi:hypothetical protein